jgi:hypothetical protein
MMLFYAKAEQAWVRRILAFAWPKNLLYGRLLYLFEDSLCKELFKQRREKYRCMSSDVTNESS